MGLSLFLISFSLISFEGSSFLFSFWPTVFGALFGAPTLFINLFAKSIEGLIFFGGGLFCGAC